MAVTRGRLLTYDSATGKGLVSEAGHQIPFDVTAWTADQLPQAGDEIEIHQNDDGTYNFNPIVKIPPLTGIFGKTGIPVLLGYIAFIIGTIFLNFIVVKMIGIQHGAVLYHFVSQYSGLLLLLLVLSYLSIAVPYFWNDRRAPIAYFMPLLVMIVVFAKIYDMYAEATQSMKVLMGSNDVPDLTEFFDFGLGLYVSLGAAIALAIIATIKLMPQK